MGKDRPKASETYTNPLFGGRTSFAQAFPTVEEATVEVEESEYGNILRKHCVTNKNGSLNEFVNCSNPRCYGGGVSIGSVLREMVSKKTTEYEQDPKLCVGYEGNARTPARKRGQCMHFFRVKARIVYKPPPAPEKSG